MKKETDKNKTTYEITINKKALLEVIEDRDGPNCLNRHYQFISEYLSFY